MADSASKDQHINKQKMAVLMKTSRVQVDRLLNPDNSKVQLDTLQRAAAAVGRKLVITLEPIASQAVGPASDRLLAWRFR